MPVSNLNSASLLLRRKRIFAKAYLWTNGQACNSKNASSVPPSYPCASKDGSSPCYPGAAALRGRRCPGQFAIRPLQLHALGLHLHWGPTRKHPCAAAYLAPRRKTNPYLQLPASRYHWSRKSNGFSQLRRRNQFVFVVACPVSDKVIWVCGRAVIVTPSLDF